VDTDVRVVLVTCPPGGTAQSIAKLLIEKDLAACVNILPKVTSIYKWKGEVCQEEEQLCLIKTSAARWPQLEVAIRKAHPYELPEIIAVPVTEGLQEYLAWVKESVVSS